MNTRAQLESSIWGSMLVFPSPVWGVKLRFHGAVYPAAGGQCWTWSPIVSLGRVSAAAKGTSCSPREQTGTRVFTQFCTPLVFPLTFIPSYFLTQWESCQINIRLRKHSSLVVCSKQLCKQSGSIQQYRLADFYLLKVVERAKLKFLSLILVLNTVNQRNEILLLTIQIPNR